MRRDLEELFDQLEDLRDELDVVLGDEEDGVETPSTEDEPEEE